MGFGRSTLGGRGGYASLGYFDGLSPIVQKNASLIFNAAKVEQYGDYEAGTLYFRDSNQQRVAATFSRSTTATRVNSSGVIESVAANVPRIDYKDGSAKLLMEPQRTNYFLNSDSPATQTITLTNGNDYTVWIEGTGSITLSDAGTGTVTEGNEVTFTASSTSLTCTVSGSVDIAQVENSSSPTSYIPTEGSTVTRNADDCSINTGSWYNDPAGTFYVKWTPNDWNQTDGVYQRVVTGEGDSSGGFFIAKNGIFLNTMRYRVKDNGGNNVFGPADYPNNTVATNKAALAMEQDNFGICMNGGTVITDNTGLQDDMSVINIAPAIGGYNGRIGQFVYFPTRLSNSNLQTLTS